MREMGEAIDRSGHEYQSAIRLMGAKDGKNAEGEGTNGVPNGPELKNRVGVSGLTSFSSFSQSWGARELREAPVCFTEVRESSRGSTERLSIPPRGLGGKVRVRSWKDETGYLRGRRMGERGGKRDGLRMERNSSSASEGKLDLIRK